MNKKTDKSKKEKKVKVAKVEKTAVSEERDTKSPAAMKRALLHKKNSLLTASQINIEKYM